MFLAKFLQHLPILAILTLAFLLRIIGVNFGLPDLYHADEPIVVNHALAYGSGDLNPHFFKIPPLVSYLLFVVYGLYFLGGLLVGGFRNPDEFLNLFLRDPTPFYLLGRVIFGVMTGTAMVYLLYRFGSKFFSRGHGLLSAFFLAVCFLHVRDSHYLYVDTPLLFFAVLSFFPILRIGDRGEKKDYLYFGVLFGTAVATKYNAVFLIFPFLIAHFINQTVILRPPSPVILSPPLNQWRAKNLGDRLLLGALLVSVCVFFVLNPFSVIDWKFFIKEMLVQSQAGGYPGFIHHFRYSLIGGMGIPIFFLSLLGIWLGLFSHDFKRGILSSFIFVYFLVLAVWSQPYDRYALPLIPFLSFFAADAFIKMGERIRVFQKWPLVFATVFAVPSIIKIAVSDYLFIQKDVRTEAREWIEREIPQDSKIAIDIPFYAPRLKPNLKQILEKNGGVSRGPISQVQRKRLDLLALQAESQPEGRYELFFLADQPSGDRFLFSNPTVPYGLTDLKNAGMDYVVVAQVDPTAHKDFYDSVRKNSELVATFHPYKMSQIEWPIDRLPLTGGPFLWKDLIARRTNGQPIRIYQLK